VEAPSFEFILPDIAADGLYVRKPALEIFTAAQLVLRRTRCRHAKDGRLHPGDIDISSRIRSLIQPS
jgi:hypothetical protein